MYVRKIKSFIFNFAETKKRLIVALHFDKVKIYRTIRKVGFTFYWCNSNKRTKCKTYKGVNVTRQIYFWHFVLLSHHVLHQVVAAPPNYKHRAYATIACGNSILTKIHFDITLQNVQLCFAAHLFSKHNLCYLRAHLVSQNVSYQIKYLNLFGSFYKKDFFFTAKSKKKRLNKEKVF